MNNRGNKGLMAVCIVIAILVIDQVIKILVKTNMCLHDSIEITPWFFISFVENSGMAYGMTFINKIVLSLFRIVAVSVIGYYIWLQVKENARRGYIICLAMIMAGAAGNIFDCMFYGLFFTKSTLYEPSYLRYPTGFRYGAVSRTCSSVRYSTSQMPASPWVLFCCCCSTAKN